MISDELKDIVEKIKTQGHMEFMEGATKEQISQFERENEIRFPQKFKEWLQYSDGGEFFLPAGVQLYGVSHKPIIDIDDNDRPNNHYLVIGTLSSGDPILCERQNETISIFNHEAGIIEENESYENFFAFLSDLYSLLGIEG